MTCSKIVKANYKAHSNQLDTTPSERATTPTSDRTAEEVISGAVESREDVFKEAVSERFYSLNA